MKIALCCLLLGILFYPGQSNNESAQSFRIIPIPARENGYGNFASKVFMSEKDLESFLKDTFMQRGWNKRRAFEEALLNAKLDFSKEALVLLRHTEGSGSVQVTFETPVLHGSNLVCEILGRPILPGYGGTGDMAYYCFAVAVSKAQVSQVELQAIEGGFAARRLAPIVLRIIKDTATCPTISVACPDTSGGNKPIKFKAIVTGKPSNEISYHWSVTKGTIIKGQGTAVIEVDLTGVGMEGLTATVEVNGFEPNCNRLASCSVGIQ